MVKENLHLMTAEVGEVAVLECAPGLATPEPLYFECKMTGAQPTFHNPAIALDDAACTPVSPKPGKASCYHELKLC